MTPETQARQQIDQKLEQAGWVIQDMTQLNLAASVGVAVREYPSSRLLRAARAECDAVKKSRGRKAKEKA